MLYYIWFIIFGLLFIGLLFIILFKIETYLNVTLQVNIESINRNKMQTQNNNDELTAKYQQKTDKQHILDNPDTYIGSVENVDTDLWLMNETNDKIVEKNITYVPGLFKLFDEGIVNCRDHVVRMQVAASANQANALPVTYIDITIQDDGTIIMTNDGNGIDIAKHPEYNIWIPELIFGHLRTSTNYDKSEKKIVGGKNGFGFKLVLIWSTYGSVETIDHTRGLKYVQEFKSNLDEICAPTITKASKAKPYTKITFKPDYQRLGLEGLTPDMLALLRKRVYDISAVTDSKLKVRYNGELIPTKNFEQYINLYIGDKAIAPRVYEDTGPGGRWEYAVALTPTNEFIQVSFVNGIHTCKGGKHVEYILTQITRKMCEYIDKKKKVKVNPNSIKEQLILFVRCDIENPAFDSQTKDFMNTPVSKFGSSCVVSDKFIEKVAKMGVMDAACAITEVKENKAAKKTDGVKSKSVRGIAKLTDANWAGTDKSKECVIIFCEGDSAKAGIISGLSSEDRNTIGVYPLKGKLLNVRGEATKKISENKEIAEIKKILGLETGKIYTPENINTCLRYGKVLFMTDQDSVSGDTPLLLKNTDDLLEINTIDNISNNWQTNVNGKEISTTDFKIWTESGWTKIKNVIRHKVTKKMYRVLTHTGVVDVTEDHSLINSLNEEISPKNLKVNDTLLHSFPNFHKEYELADIENIGKMDIKQIQQTARQLNIQHYLLKKKQILIDEITQKMSIPYEHIPEVDFGITAQEAYLMGLFWADGTCCVYTWTTIKKPIDRPREYLFTRTSYNWSITNTNLDFLTRAKNILAKIYPEYQVNIVHCDKNHKNEHSISDVYKLIINGGKKISPIIEKYRNLFYDKDKNKKIPIEILNASILVKTQFFEGYYDGDGSKSPYHGTSFDVNGKIGSHGLYLLCKTIGYSVSINIKDSKRKVYTLTLTKGKQQDNPIRVKKIIDLGETEQYVYDLETENHHFQAGVGELIVHNTDGSHIKGLCVNLFQSEWESLLHIPSFIGFMNTPILKAKKGNAELNFYNEGEYEEWKDNNDDKGWHIKYYKGLGTSTGKEFKEYFENKKIVGFVHNGKISDEAIDMVFNKKRPDDRKEWLKEYKRDSFIDTSKQLVSYEEFINKELIHFSKYDCDRSIPNLMDGLKISLRKILFAAFKKNLTTEIKVAQFSGYVSEHSGYHHGEASLNAAIVGMAQDFVGSNNINLLEPHGQFGGRLKGGQDSASERYIFTQLNKLTRAIFPQPDDHILEYLNDDGTPVEPIYYAPIIPMVLVNGSMGIGTGFSTDIMCYDPIQIIRYLKSKLSASSSSSSSSSVQVEDEFIPYYEGFKGLITKITNDKILIKGVYEKVGPDKIRVIELPVGFWTENFKELLENLIEPGQDKEGKKITPIVKDYDDMSRDTNVDFTITFAKGKVEELEANKGDYGCNGIEKLLKLYTTNTTTNMHLFDADDILQKYNKISDIIDAYYEVRLQLYQTRKEYMIKTIEKELVLLSNKAKYIKEILDDTIDLRKKKKEQVVQMLSEKGYDIMDEDGEYKYLIKMPMDSVTEENVAKILNDKDKKEQELFIIKSTTIYQMWSFELDNLLEQYLEYKAARQRLMDGVVVNANKKKIVSKGRAPVKKTTKKMLVLEE